MRHSHVQAIGTAVPRYRAPQSRVAEWAKHAAAGQLGVRPDSDRELRKALAAIERIYRQSAIRYRNSVVPDYDAEPEEFVFYPKDWSLAPSPSTEARMRVYRQEAPPLARAAAERCLDAAPDVPRSAVSHLVVVTCTGFFAPGLDTILIRELGLRPEVKRQIVGFMGCYAAFNGLRAADSICRSDPEAAVLVVCVELCSIHFQRELTIDNIVANCLFGDGAAAALVTSEPAGSRRGRVEILDSHSLVAEDSVDQMTWDVTDTGFKMTLSADVPDTLRRGVEPFVDALLGRNGLSRRDVAFWAVHPGGRRIVEAVRDCVGLGESEMAPSFEVLAEHGNMSSPTILFVIDRCLARGPRSGDLGVALAFGPGLTLESMLFRAV